MKAGVAKWDVNYVAFDNYEDYVPYHKKYDLLGMTQHGLLKMVPDLIDTVNRHIVALHGHFRAVAFNKQLIASDRIPATWDGKEAVEGNYDVLREWYSNDISELAIAHIVDVLELKSERFPTVEVGRLCRPFVLDVNARRSAMMRWDPIK